MSTTDTQPTPVGRLDKVEILINCPQLRLPSLDLFSNKTRDDRYLTEGVPLYHAALSGDWETLKRILEKSPDLIRARITKGHDTALHIATAARRTRLVKELVNLMTPKDLALQNRIGNTALCFAASSGAVSSAKAMVKKNGNLPVIRGYQRMTPLCMAALKGHREMVDYLYEVTSDDDLTPQDRIELLVTAINTDLYDVALKMVKRHPELAIARDGNGETALHVLARKPEKPDGSQLGVWRRCVNLFVGNNMAHNKNSMPPQALQLVECVWEQVIQLKDSEISNLIGAPWRLLFVAAELGNVEFITKLIRLYPDLIWKIEENHRSIFHVAVLHRREKIFNLIFELNAIKDLIAAYTDENQNNMLHLAGMLAPPSRLNIVSGAALQMQRELLWFKEVEKIVQPQYTKAENKNGKTPQALFTDQHKALMIEGEKWMKDTATSCMLVATLIATMVFTAAFTVPGGHNDEGIPIFFKKKYSFTVFAISDAVSLFSSAASILMFLSILTSRYAEADFLKSLPLKLIMGLSSLFVSMATMMVAFCATFFIVFTEGLAWVAILTTLIASVPVTLFAFQQYPLLADIVRSTYGSNFLFHPSKHLLY